jgi:hypothetical protein
VHVVATLFAELGRFDADRGGVVVGVSRRATVPAGEGTRVVTRMLVCIDGASRRQ